MTARRYTPSTLVKELERVVQRHFYEVVVEGEVSQRHVPASGHCYLTLRDRQATLSVVMWRNDWQRSGYKPEAGDRVLCSGRLGLYGGQSRYQLYARSVQPAGEGARAKQLAAIRARLERDGLLDERRKRPLPLAPRVVGVATSLTGAALQDFLRVSAHRWPAARILVAGCTVQGPDAPSEVIRALELLAEDGRAEVLVVTRGGGSREDLAAFDDEYLARWIAGAPVPVISAIGHEVDTTIADLVADVVAATPSAAAMKALPDRSSWIQKIDDASASLGLVMQRRLQHERQRLISLRARLRGPRQRIGQAHERRVELEARLDAAWTRLLSRERRRVASLERELTALSPLSVLERGYAIVKGPEGVVRDATALGSGDSVEIRLSRGVVGATVDDVRDDPATSV